MYCSSDLPGAHESCFHDWTDHFAVFYITAFRSIVLPEKSNYSTADLSPASGRSISSTPSKKECILTSKRAEFLRLVLGRNGIHLYPHEVDVTRKWPRLINLAKLQGVHGLEKLFLRFIPNFSALAATISVFLHQR